MAVTNGDGEVNVPLTNGQTKANGVTDSSHAAPLEGQGEAGDESSDDEAEGEKLNGGTQMSANCLL